MVTEIETKGFPQLVLGKKNTVYIHHLDGEYVISVSGVTAFPDTDMARILKMSEIEYQRMFQSFGARKRYLSVDGEEICISSFEKMRDAHRCAISMARG